MESTNAFERQLSRVASEVAGPVRSVDAMAVVRSAQAAPARRWSVITRLQSGSAARTEGGLTMFSALKFVAAGVIVALFGGFLLAGVLTTPRPDGVVPAAVTESPSPMATEESSSGMDAFPTGHFVSVETGRVMLEFHGDGTGIHHDSTLETATSFTYAVDGDVFTALTAAAVGAESHNPATYRWDYDGERLAFDLIGEDTSDRRESRMSYTYQPIEDPRVVMVATSDLDVGAPIRALRGFVPAAEVGPDAYTSKVEYVGHVAAVPISKGQPITPDLLELPPSD